MPRLRLLAAFGLAFVLIATTVAQEKKDSVPAPKKEDDKKAAPPVVPPAVADAGLAWRFTKDVPFYQELTTTTIQNIKVQGLKVCS